MSFKCAIGNLVICMKVSDTYACAAYLFGSCTFRLAYSYKVEQVHAVLLVYRLVTPQRYNVRDRTSIIVITTDHYIFTALLLLLCLC